MQYIPLNLGLMNFIHHLIKMQHLNQKKAVTYTNIYVYKYRLYFGHWILGQFVMICISYSPKLDNSFVMCSQRHAIP